MAFKSTTILKSQAILLVIQKFLSVFHISFCIQVMEKKKVSEELVALNLVLIMQRGLAANVETEGKVTMAKSSRSLRKGDT